MSLEDLLLMFLGFVLFSLVDIISFFCLNLIKMSLVVSILFMVWFCVSKWPTKEENNFMFNLISCVCWNLLYVYFEIELYSGLPLVFSKIFPGFLNFFQPGF